MSCKIYQPNYDPRSLGWKEVPSIGFERVSIAERFKSRRDKDNTSLTHRKCDVSIPSKLANDKDSEMA